MTSSIILPLRTSCQSLFAARQTYISFFGDTIAFQKSEHLNTIYHIENEKEANKYIEKVSLNYNNVATELIKYQLEHKLNDWVFYQLIRKVASELVPKSLNFEMYTICKWFLLNKCGYNAKIVFVNKNLLLYVQSNDNIYDVPLFMLDKKQFVCLNIHDFDKVNFNADSMIQVEADLKSSLHPFSYRIDRLPDFDDMQKNQKELKFVYKEDDDTYPILVVEQIANFFSNYPSVDFELYFNIPLSRPIYQSLIPKLKRRTAKMNQADGIDYLMNFTRNAFVYKTDQKNFGSEKRLSPEQTLVNKFSDCDDRAALFYYLVKEIYNLPMIVIVFPEHVAIGVALKYPLGNAIAYNGKYFSLCEPTPQKIALPLGELMPDLKDVAFEIAFAYDPL